MPGALGHIRVLDLTQMLAGPFCTQLLADQGAEVIKIEAPGGDIARRLGPYHPRDQERAFGGYFQSINRGKRSLVLDLKTAADRDVFLRLVPTAHVLVENFRSGVMERLGLGYEVLRARNRGLVYGAIRGFGDRRGGESPYVRWPALDVVAQAMGGVMGITGPDADTPLKVGPGIGDTIPALFLGFGLVCALNHAERTGDGQFVDVSMVDSVLAICERIVHQRSYAGLSAQPEGNRHPLLCPFGLVPARDGWATVACPADHFWKELCAALDLADMATDPRYATNDARLLHADDVYREISAKTSELTKSQLVARLGGRVPFGPVYAADDVFNDPHFRARAMLMDLEHPGVDEPLTVAGSPVKLTGTPAVAHARAPRLGEDQALFDFRCTPTP